VEVLAAIIDDLDIRVVEESTLDSVFHNINIAIAFFRYCFGVIKVKRSVDFS